jgi:hypothetical protein
MTRIRVEESYDGICTVYIGQQVVVAGLSRLDADRLADAFRCRSGATPAHVKPPRRG